MQSGILILGDHLPDPKSSAFATQAERHRQIVELGVEAEQLGFDSIWLGEHHFCDYILSSPSVVLAAISERTSRLRLGTGVALLANHDPIRLAEDYATLDILSGGRVELGVGRGLLKRIYSDFGQDANQSREMFEEKLRLLIRVWSEKDVFWSGKFRPTLEGVTVQPRPAQKPHPPIWIAGGTSRESVLLAGSLGLGLILPTVIPPPSAFRRYVELYRETYLEAGHDPRRMAVGACSHVHVAHDSQVARERWRPYHMNYFEWLMGPLMAWGTMNVGRGIPPSGSVPEFATLLKGPSICGSAAEVAERIDGMREMLGLDLHISMFDHGCLPEVLLRESMELFAGEVLPKLGTA